MEIDSEEHDGDVFGSFRKANVTFLELGVGQVGSLSSWELVWLGVGRVGS